MTAFNSSWVPDENSQTLFSERCWLQGMLIAAIAYGITLPLYFFSFHHLVRRDKNYIGSRSRSLLLAFLSISGILGTIYVITLAGYTQMVFIDYRNYPGGPNAFENTMFSVPINYTGGIAYFVSNWISDAVVVWRFKVVYQTCGVPMWIVMFLPCSLLAGSVAMGIVFLVRFQTTTIYADILANFGLPFIALSLALNIILTLAIVLRLLALRHHIVSVMGSAYGTRYLSAAAMVVESAALYSAVSIAYIILFGRKNAVSQVFLQSINQFQIIAALLIVFRVAQGKGWNQATAACMTSPGLGPESMRSASSRRENFPEGDLGAQG